MRNYSIAVLAVFGLLTARAFAQGDAERDAMLYLESVGLEKKAKVCAARIPQFAPRFDTAFAAWRIRNADALRRGETFLRADAAKNNIPFEVNVQAVTDTAAQMLEKTNQRLLEENCNAFLAQVGA